MSKPETPTEAQPTDPAPTRQLKHTKRGRTNPLRLSLPQTYLLSGVIFAGNVAILVALILGASRNREALRAVAEAARVVPRVSASPERFAEPSKSSCDEAIGASGGADRTLRLSIPTEWRWRGCQEDSAGAVEILFSPR